MKKILLGTSAILGVLTMVASSASAQNLTTMKDQKSSMKASLGGTVGVVVGEQLWSDGGSNGGTTIALPDWRNIISAQADGTASTLGLTYGAYIRWRPFDDYGTSGPGGNTDKVYAYMGQKYFGTISVGRKESVLSDYFISPTDLVPGYSVDGDIQLGQYGTNAYEITYRAKKTSVSYKTPSIFGISLGYTYIPALGQNKNVTNVLGETAPALSNPSGGTSAYADVPVHDIAGRYDVALGPVTIGVMSGGRIAEGDGALTGGLQVGYTDGKNIGVSLNGNFVAGGDGDREAWGIGMSLDTPRVAGLSLGMLFSEASNHTVTDAGRSRVSDYQYGVGLGYAWSENFAQSFSWHTTFSGVNTDPTAATSAWALASQVSF